MKKTALAHWWSGAILLAITGLGCGATSPACPYGQSNCGGICVNTSTDRSNCGVCGNECPEGLVCEEGACVEGCTDECAAAGEAQCSGDGYDLCDDHDGDGCLEWGGHASCPRCSACTGGDCLTSCTDECNLGDRMCYGEGFRECGNYDQDQGYEWSDVVPCDPQETCEDGTCVFIGPPTDEDGDGFLSSVDCDDLDPFTHPPDPEQGTPGGLELCDGKDNDCDTQTDEDCAPCGDGDTQPCGTELGVCTAGTQACGGGSWGSCSGQGPSPEQPDGLDNDCDGATDEDLPCQESQTQDCGTDLGLCSPGQQQCENGVWSQCLGGQPPAAERCDGLDNDCDRQVDEGFMVDLSCEGVGACGAGVFECASDATTRCSTEPGGIQDQSGPELCDALDNDCDGEVDEDFPGLGSACTAGTGNCQVDGMVVCRADGGGTECMPESQPGSAEICDGVDNDCDGQTDEDFADLGIPCSLGTGDCYASGTMVCRVDAGGTECTAKPGRPSPERCDGKDNDCDTQTDEGSGLDLCSPFPDQVVNGSCRQDPLGCTVADPAADCEPGWWDYNGEWGDGCELRLDQAADNCATATKLPDVTDMGGLQRAEVTGNLVPAADEDWYQVVGMDNVDQDEFVDQCDNYRVSIRFTGLQSPGVVFDVYRNTCASSECRDDTVYEHFTDFSSGFDGECPCRVNNLPGFNICRAQNNTFHIRVHRVLGAPVTADPYTIEITNGI